MIGWILLGILVLLGLYGIIRQLHMICRGLRGS